MQCIKLPEVCSLLNLCNPLLRLFCDSDFYSVLKHFRNVVFFRRINIESLTPDLSGDSPVLFVEVGYKNCYNFKYCAKKSLLEF
ncbi:MAG: hypothetical protein A2161_18175 [Candidatus Schekmanbacteria bacterium RBG_13_48_7]|uniref:Uncharacterized protein n=1 Tax=Candidatus Schekmanbacteria bacterium RBG_13_48_7 TaxID=1817878 RepID=A0A1F7RQS3_9BACT|nr:MAG: hypothetical protein A2161_18175 [Candidatus Schekmanbacteria bacterium RBG_13_48_7]